MYPVKHETYKAFFDYVRRMLNDMASGHTGTYHNKRQIQEVVVVWNPADEPLEGYPDPENITHIKAVPHVSGLDCGEYVFKDIVCRLMIDAGYKDHDRMLISETEGDEFSCNMCSGCADEPPAWHEDGACSEIYYFMIRSNKDLSKALSLFRTIKDEQLHAAIKDVLKEHRRYLESDSPLPSTTCATPPAP